MRSEKLEVGSGIEMEFTKANTHGVFTSHLPPLVIRGDRWGVGSGVRKELAKINSNILTSRLSHLTSQLGDTEAKYREVSIW